ncbi:MAG: acetone carboxylase subunit gamma [Actinobacteria bacterium]|jgi:acetone carboxylase gamma subunit|nr:acetone carboxylase subunit gamma [Actinomycetota bacterium]MCL6095104.1 acetone carboxylase subunit gamma [Actinomycetota bacterium]
MDQATLADLIDGKLPWHQLKEVLSGTKDIDRFDLYLEVMQSRVAFPEKILLPLAEHLYVVSSGDGRRLVKCDCGYEFGPLERNWKESAAVLVRDSEELLEEIYDPWHRCDPAWMELREFYCPGCWSLLELEAVPPGYPVIFDFRPDIDTFYREYLGREPE